MIFSTLIVGSHNDLLSSLSTTFNKNRIKPQWVESGNDALIAVSKNNFDLLVVDEELKDWTGKNLIEKIVYANPQINCVAVSSLTKEEFHEFYEGLGVLMQLSEKSDQNDFQKLIELADRIITINSK